MMMTMNERREEAVEGEREKEEGMRGWRRRRRRRAPPSDHFSFPFLLSLFLT
jgi:hypothetical protein